MADNGKSKYEITKEMQERLDKTFTYHSPHGDQADRYAFIRKEGRILAHVIVGNTPPSREQSLALTKLEEAIMHANAAIARNEPDPEGIPF